MTEVKSTVESASQVPSWITGWRLIAIALGTSLSLFMIQTESSITSTAITAITNTLGGFDRSSWVFTSYLATYSSVGAGGIVAIGILYGFELRPPEKWPGYSAFITLAVAVSLAIAPVIGAAFTDAGQWRWCFLMNVPIGVTTIIILLFTMPNKLRLEPAAHLADSGSFLQRLASLRRLDFLGVFILAGASVLLMTALQQAAEGVSVFMAMLGNAWLSGLVLVVAIVQIPQRFMLVNSLSAIDAGVRLLPFAAVVASTSVLTAIIASKAKIPAINVLIFGACIEVAGVAGLSRASTQPTIESSQYGFQILAGAGVGIYNIILILLTPYVLSQMEP
ncbi:hypothetical protein DL764_009175 [Monosporascus ibericus]|uniref:Major facilitator superfamily (MFS) profile domain-containing protein n=1 Tax=Monosporascus ibericus TaxID=155417 RepID=A0A4V1X921_9PEZI|nr:hypothetical protein DL764_009175 [Monosporascus ibericus]